MVSNELFKALVVLGPGVALVGLGVAIIVQGGGVNPGGVRGLARNLSRAVLVVGAGLLGLAAVQGLVGFRLDGLG